MNNDELIVHTPIFDVLKRNEVESGFRPIAVKSPDWVAICAQKNGKWLLTKQLRFGTMSEIEEFPCGCVEENEDPKVAAIRELSEETGYNVSLNDLYFLGKFAANPGFMTNFMHYFFVDLDKVRFVKSEQHLDAHEKLTVYWKDKDTFRKEFNETKIKPIFVAGMFYLLD